MWNLRVLRNKLICFEKDFTIACELTQVIMFLRDSEALIKSEGAIAVNNCYKRQRVKLCNYWSGLRLDNIAFNYGVINIYSSQEEFILSLLSWRCWDICI